MLKELKLIKPKLKDQGLIEKLLQEILKSIKLESLALQGILLGRQSHKLLCEIIEVKMPCLEHIDLSWCKMGTLQLEKLLESARGNHYIQTLNLAHNPVSAKHDLESLCAFIKNNPQLQHLDLSGVLQTPEQVRRVVKKAKKSVSLLVLHLSSTPCIQFDEGLKKYIMRKLKANKLPSGQR